jgi:hypothetical protein
MYGRLGTLADLYAEEWKVVSNYDDFINEIVLHHNEITHISFDHDLGEDVALAAIDRGMSKRQARKKLKKNVKSGYDCAVFVKDYYRHIDKPLPVLLVHSMNPVGTQNIINLFKK